MPTANGKAHNGQPSASPGGLKLGDRLRQLRQNDGVLIGSPIYVPGDEDDTCSWEDLAKQVAAIQWLVPGWIPYGMLGGIIGSPKAGKSAFALYGLVRPIITGCNWFNGMPGPEPGYVVFCDTERRGAVNMKRAAEWGLPLDRIKTPFKDDPKRPIDLDNDEHIDRILNVVCRYKAKLVIVDSFRGSHKGDENNSRIVKPLQALASIAEETKAAVQILHHTGKPREGAELDANSARGSNAFLAMVGCQIAIDQPQGPKATWRRVQMMGENLGVSPSPVGFQFTANGLEFGTPPEKPRRATERDKAEAWLRENMKPGEWLASNDLVENAKQFGFSGNAIQRAREDLGITQAAGTIRKKEDNRYEWRLPSPGETKGGN